MTDDDEPRVPTSDGKKPKDDVPEAEWAGMGVSPTGFFGSNRAMPSAKFLKKSREDDGDLKVTRDDSWRNHKEEEG